MQTVKDYFWLFWGHLGYLILAEQSSSGLACADHPGLLVVFTFKKPSLTPLRVAVSDVAVSQVAVFLAAWINITNYNPDWVCGLFLADLELHNSSTALCSMCEDPGSTPARNIIKCRIKSPSLSPKEHVLWLMSPMKAMARFTFAATHREINRHTEIWIRSGVPPFLLESCHENNFKKAFTV